MNFTEKKFHSKIRKPKVEIEKLMSRGYLQRNRQIRKQPRIKPRLGMFGRSISVKVTRDEPVQPISKRIQARLNDDLDYLLEYDSSSSKNVNKDAKNTTKKNVGHQKTTQEKNYALQVVKNNIPIKNSQFQTEKKTINKTDNNVPEHGVQFKNPNFVLSSDVNFAVQNTDNRKHSKQQNAKNLLNDNSFDNNLFENVNQFTDNYENNPLIDTCLSFNVGNETPAAAIDLSSPIIEISSTTSNNDSIRFDRPEYDMDTMKCNIRASYQDETLALSESPSDILKYINRHSAHKNLKNTQYKPTNNTYLPEATPALNSDQSVLPDFSSFRYKKLPTTSLYFDTPLETPSGTYMISEITTFHKTVSTTTSYPYETAGSYSTPKPPPVISTQTASKIPIKLTTILLNDARKTRERVFNEPRKITNRIRNELTQIKERSTEAKNILRSESRIKSITASSTNIELRIDNPELADVSIDDYSHNMFNFSPTHRNYNLTTPNQNTFLENIPYYSNSRASVFVNELNNNWQLDIPPDKNDQFFNGYSRDNDFDFFSCNDLF